MGKWNYRRRWTPKNYYRDQRLPSPPTYYETEFKLRGAWKNVDLPWEERFCISVGIPWEKVVTAKKYTYCHDNVVKWNDSASEATFSEAKERFWAQINGLPSDLPEPDPDMYIHEIDWNPEIDPELVKDLDKAYFNPDEMDKVENFDDSKKNGDDLVPGCILGLENKNASNSHDPWECNNSTNKNISDPWERGNTQEDRETKDVTWGGGADKPRDRNITWGGGESSLWHKDVTWGGGANNSWHRNYYPAQRMDDISKNTWACARNAQLGWRNNRDNRAWNGRESTYVDNSQPSGALTSRQRGRCRDTSFGREQWHAQHDVPNSYRKREGSHQYTSSYKSARVQSDDNQWGRQRTQNRGHFGRE